MNKNLMNFGYISCSSKIILFNSLEGQSIFMTAAHKNAFFKMAPHYVPQQHIATCGVASAVIILNCIYVYRNIPRPLSPKSLFINSENNKSYGNFLWDENNFFTKEVRTILDKDIIIGKSKIDNKYCPGLTLLQLTNAMNALGVKAKNYFIDNHSASDLNRFRLLIRKITSDFSQFMIINYHMKLQASNINNGHFSPIAAYDEQSDMILILDTWSSFSPWYWANIKDVFNSMNTLDGSNYRGFILVDLN